MRRHHVQHCIVGIDFMLQHFWFIAHKNRSEVIHSYQSTQQRKFCLSFCTIAPSFYNPTMPAGRIDGNCRSILPLGIPLKKASNSSFVRSIATGKAGVNRIPHVPPSILGAVFSPLAVQYVQGTVQINCGLINVNKVIWIVDVVGIRYYSATKILLKYRLCRCGYNLAYSRSCVCR